MKNIDYGTVNITGGFWHEKAELNRKITIDAVYDRFYDTGRITAFEFNMKESGITPHVFWDSDVAKWIEGAAMTLRTHPNAELEAKIEKIIDGIEKNRRADGYFNIYYQQCHPGVNFTCRTDHELYCAGHLIEAAVEYCRVTGKDRFLKLMGDYADCIYRIFVEEDSAAFTTPGHEEIELALIKLYRFTGKKKYLDLAKFFIDKRGNNEKEKNPALMKPSDRPEYDQHHLPVREQHEALGHCVRALYLYSGMADLAVETGDNELWAACEDLIHDVTEKKMYITGGVGSTNEGEAFTVPYDLPNDKAYTETCAAISLMFFANRMLQYKNSAFYADIVERAMYNGFLSGLSLDGRRFFYTNPLEINRSMRKRHTSTNTDEYFPIMQRVEVFGCSCCPPNINRVLPSMGQYAYGVDGRDIYINQFMDSTYSDGGITVSVKTDYPVNGKIEVTAKGAERIMIRIPSWAKSHEINADCTYSDGYAAVSADADGKISFTLTLDMTPVFVSADPRVLADSGKLVVMRGPVVYCAEGGDSTPELDSLLLDPAAPVEVLSEFFGGLPMLRAGAFKCEQGSLYEEYGKQSLTPTSLDLIPYSTFANRGERDMKVWISAYHHSRK